MAAEQPSRNSCNLGEPITLSTQITMRAPLSDEHSLMEAFREGKEQAFEQLFRQWYPALCSFAARLTGNPDTGPDIAQEAFIKVWEKKSLFYSPQALSAYLYKTAKHDGLKWLEKNKRMQTHVPANRSVERFALENMIKAETIRLLHAAMEQLPAQTRQIIKKMYVEGSTVKTVAAEMGLALSTVKTHQARALQKLRLWIPYKSFLLIWLLAAGSTAPPAFFEIGFQ